MRSLFPRVVIFDGYGYCTRERAGASILHRDLRMWVVGPTVRWESQPAAADEWASVTAADE